MEEEHIHCSCWPDYPCCECGDMGTFEDNEDEVREID